MSARPTGSETNAIPSAGADQPRTSAQSATRSQDLSGRPRGATVVWLIARREIVDHLQSLRFLALVALALALMPLGTYVNGKSYEARQLFFESLRARQQEVLAAAVESRSWAPLWGWERGDAGQEAALRALRPPAALSILALGHDGTMPGYWQFGVDGLSEGPPLARYEGLAGLLGDVDLLFVTQVVLGLLALLIAFDAISGEKESGTLRAVLANPVSRVHLVLGKYLGGLVSLMVPLGIGTIASLIALQLMGFDLFTGEALWRIGLFLLGATLYLSASLGLGLAVSALTHSQRTSLVLLLVLWVTLVLVLPRAATLTASAARPAEPEELIRQKKLAALRGLEEERAQAMEDLWVSSGGEIGRVTSSPSAEVEQRYRPAFERSEAEFFRRRRNLIRELDESRSRALEHQLALAGVISRLSPAATFGFLATEVAGTGESARQRWNQQVRVHQRELEQLLFDRSFGLEVRTKTGSARSYPHPDSPDAPPGYGELPQFSYRPATLGQAVSAAMPDLFLLVLFNALVLGVTMGAFLRYDVR